MAEIVIRVPMAPPSTLSINSRAHHMEKYRDTKMMREAARLATLQAVTGGQPVPVSIAVWKIGFTIAWGKGRKSVDDDNAFSMCKAMRDGVADALGVDDRFFRQAGIVQRRDPEGIGNTVIRIAPEES